MITKIICITCLLCFYAAMTNAQKKSRRQVTGWTSDGMEKDVHQKQ